MKLGWYLTKVWARNMASIFVFGAAAYALVYSGKKIIAMADQHIYVDNIRNQLDFQRIVENKQA